MDQSLFLFGWRHLKSWRKKSDGRPSPSLSLSYFSCVVLLPPPELNHAQATPFMFLFFCVEWKKNTDSFKSWAVLPRSHQHPPPPTHTHTQRIRLSQQEWMLQKAQHTVQQPFHYTLDKDHILIYVLPYTKKLSFVHLGNYVMFQSSHKCQKI
jgi:hypothetical protein